MSWSRSRPRSADYGADWQRIRAAWAARHQPADICTRCPNQLGPMGPWLHLDHSDDRSTILGFAHGSCNVQAGARAGRARQTASPIRV